MLYYAHSSFSPSQQCCYGSDGNILTGTDGGSAYSVYPNNWKSFLGKKLERLIKLILIILQVIWLLMLPLIICVVMGNISQVARVVIMTGDLMIIVKNTHRGHHQV